MNIEGVMLIGSLSRGGAGKPFEAVDPRTGQAIEPSFQSGTGRDVDQACELARQAFDQFREVEPATRAEFLERIAEEIEAVGDLLIERASLETGLPLARLQGERGRTIGQLRMFADHLRAGEWVEAVIAPAQPERTPLAQPDLRRRHVAVGPVAVFGASNFPLAFSVAGGDTASALAAGCPVVAKGHPAHPGTSELVGKAIRNAVAACGLHEGVFSLLVGEGPDVGTALVAHPAIKSVGFTGSARGGTALMAVAAARPEPIPVHAEMGSVNPVFLFPGALDARAEAMAEGFAGSLNMGSGQFCTNPGLVIAVDGPGLDKFVIAAVEALARQSSAPMLTPAIHAAYRAGVLRTGSHKSVSLLGRGSGETEPHGCNPALFKTDAQSFIDHPELGEENFGAASVIVVCRDPVEMQELTESLAGQLTVTLHGENSDIELMRPLIPAFERKAGRILVNGWPTGVEVNPAMVHGGPFPACSDARTTSVGTLAIRRFLRPVCYQNFPAQLLPAVLQDDNPLRVPQQHV